VFMMPASRGKVVRSSWVKWLLGGIGATAVLGLALRTFWVAHLAAQSYSDVSYSRSGATDGLWVMGLFFLLLTFLPILLAVIVLRHGETQNREE